MINNKPIYDKYLGNWLNLKISIKVVAIIHKPAKVAYVIPARNVFIAWDNENIQKNIVSALNDDGKIFEKPKEFLAKKFDAVPKNTASIKKISY